MKKNISMIISIFALVIAIGTYLFLTNEIEILSKDYSELKTKYEGLENTVTTNLEPTIRDLKAQLAEYKGDKKNYIIDDFYSSLKNQTVFLTDFENYNFPTDKKAITEREASDRALAGFQRSARFIAGEGAFEVNSESIKSQKVCANSFFTIYPTEGYKMYKDIERECFVVTRENELGCGISVYVDKQTGLIIGGTAYGD